MSSSFQQILKDLGVAKEEIAPAKANIPVPPKPDSLSLSIQGAKFIKPKDKNELTERDKFLEKSEGPFSAEALALSKPEAARVVWEIKHRNLNNQDTDASDFR